MKSHYNFVVKFCDEKISEISFFLSLILSNIIIRAPRTCLFSTIESINHILFH